MDKFYFRPCSILIRRANNIGEINQRLIPWVVPVFPEHFIL